MREHADEEGHKLTDSCTLLLVRRRLSRFHFPVVVTLQTVERKRAEAHHDRRVARGAPDDMGRHLFSNWDLTPLYRRCGSHRVWTS